MPVTTPAPTAITAPASAALTLDGLDGLDAFDTAEEAFAAAAAAVTPARSSSAAVSSALPPGLSGVRMPRRGEESPAAPSPEDRARIASLTAELLRLREADAAALRKLREDEEEARRYVDASRAAWREIEHRRRDVALELAQLTGHNAVDVNAMGADALREVAG